MQAQTTRVTQGGRLVIPAAIRKALNLEDGDLVMLHVEGKILQVMAMTDQLDAIQACCAPVLGPGAVDEFLAERRREAAREQD